MFFFQVPYGSPTAPPAHHFHPQPPYPGPPPPPPYDTTGTFTYGFQSPPPPYSGDTSPGYYQGHSPAAPGPYVPPPAAPGPYVAPPMPPGGFGLYPDLTQLQQPPQGMVLFISSFTRLDYELTLNTVKLCTLLLFLSN